MGNILGQSFGPLLYRGFPCAFSNSREKRQNLPPSLYRSMNPITRVFSIGLFTKALHCFSSLQLIAKQLFSTIYATEHSSKPQQISMHSSIERTGPLSEKFPAPNPPTRSLSLYTFPFLHMEWTLEFVDLVGLILGNVGLVVDGVAVGGIVVVITLED